MKLFCCEVVKGRIAVGLLLVRLVVGAAFILHGWPKIQNAFGWAGTSFPPFLQALAALSEFGGGIALVLGLLTCLATLGIGATMIVAITMVHVPKGDPFIGMAGSWEIAAVYLVVMILLCLAGPGEYSLDVALFKKKA